jgi:hypothetical protein
MSIPRVLTSLSVCALMGRTCLAERALQCYCFAHLPESKYMSAVKGPRQRPNHHAALVLQYRKSTLIISHSYGHECALQYTLVLSIDSPSESLHSSDDPASHGLGVAAVKGTPAPALLAKVA